MTQVAIGTEVYRIRSAELGLHGRASLPALCHLLQESASLHAHELQSSPTQLLAQGMTWFLARMQLRIDRYPGWRDPVTVETWPAEHVRLYAIRDFCVLDEQGREMAVASTWWVLMDAVRRRPIMRMPERIRKLHPLVPRRALPGDPPRLERVERGDHEQRFRLRPSEVDLNGHVNHVVYISHLVESVPDEVWRQRQVCELDIEFKAECHDGDVVLALCSGESEAYDIFRHSLLRERDGREVTRARSRWRRAEGWL